ncbi:MAG: Asp23/Gls24 family envelope stress response protein [Lentisphaerae bacterium]|nr:Asp23/Gls24 family envelope stress response protein [Lentisphaerota bacterium]
MLEKKRPAGAPSATIAPRAEPETAEEHGEDGTDLGAIRIHNSVMAAIARLAALKVPGVVEMSGSFAEGLASMVSKASFDRGIRVDIADQKVNLELHIVIAFGVRIPQVAWRLQNEVRQAIEDMTGKKVGLINVIIQGVKTPEPMAPSDLQPNKAGNTRPDNSKGGPLT